MILTDNSHQKQTTSPQKMKPLFGSMTKLYHHECIIVDPSTGERIRNILIEEKVRSWIQRERAAKKVIFSLRNRCLRPHQHIPSTEELTTVFEALRVLWLLLPPIKRHSGESNKKYFLRTLDEVGRFRGVDMFSKD